MTEPEITVHKLRYHVPVQLLGLDDQGRQLYRCPSAGCGETAYFDEDGRGHCPTDEAMAAYLREAMESMRGDMHVAADMLYDWADELSPAPACDHAARLELSVPGDSRRTWQCTTCGAWIRTPWAS